MSERTEGDDAWAQLAYKREQRSTWPGMVDAARCGDTEAARKLIGMVAAGLGDSRVEIPPEVRDYMAGCLEDIEAGKDPRDALHLKGSRSQSYWKMERDADIAKAVKWEFDAPYPRVTLDEACRIVESKYRAFAREAGVVGYEAVRKAYLRFFPKDRGKR